MIVRGVNGVYSDAQRPCVGDDDITQRRRISTAELKRISGRMVVIEHHQRHDKSEFWQVDILGYGRITCPTYESIEEAVLNSNGEKLPPHGTQREDKRSMDDRREAFVEKLSRMEVPDEVQGFGDRPTIYKTARGFLVQTYFMIGGKRVRFYFGLFFSEKEAKKASEIMKESINEEITRRNEQHIR